MVQDYDTGGTFRSLGTRTDTGTLFGRTMGLVAVTVGLFTLGAYLARTLSGGWAMAFWIASFVCLLAMNVTVRQSEQLTLGLLFGFDLLVGLATAPTISYYANVDPEAVWEAGGATALFVAGFGAGGYATRRDLSALARVLWWALIALIAVGVVLVFVSIPGGSVVYAILGVGDLRWSGDVRLPAAACHQGDRQRAAAGGLDLPRHPQRPPVLPHAVRSEAPLTAQTEPRRRAEAQHSNEPPMTTKADDHAATPVRTTVWIPDAVTGLAAGTDGKLMLLLGDDQ